MSAAAVEPGQAQAPGPGLPPGRAGVEPCDVHVLLVDDERLSRIVVGGLLRKCQYRGAQMRSNQHRSPAKGYSLQARQCRMERLTGDVPAVTEAGSGLEALEMLRKNEPGTFSLILTVRSERQSLQLLLLLVCTSWGVACVVSGRVGRSENVMACQALIALFGAGCDDAGCGRRGAAAARPRRRQPQQHACRQCAALSNTAWVACCCAGAGHAPGLAPQRSWLKAVCASSAVMSANEHTGTVFECIRGGAEDYLLKPVTRKEVQHMWQHVWRRQQSAQRVPHLGADEVRPLGRQLAPLAACPACAAQQSFTCPAQAQEAREGEQLRLKTSCAGRGPARGACRGVGAGAQRERGAGAGVGSRAAAAAAGGRRRCSRCRT